jgi:hypothetical protein
MAEFDFAIFIQKKSEGYNVLFIPAFAEMTKANATSNCSTLQLLEI